MGVTTIDGCGYCGCCDGGCGDVQSPCEAGTVNNYYEYGLAEQQFVGTLDAAPCIGTCPACAGMYSHRATYTFEASGGPGITWELCPNHDGGWMVVSVVATIAVTPPTGCSVVVNVEPFIDILYEPWESLTGGGAFVFSSPGTITVTFDRIAIRSCDMGAIFSDRFLGVCVSTGLTGQSSQCCPQGSQSVLSTDVAFSLSYDATWGD